MIAHGALHITGDAADLVGSSLGNEPSCQGRVLWRHTGGLRGPLESLGRHLDPRVLLLPPLPVPLGRVNALLVVQEEGGRGASVVAKWTAVKSTQLHQSASWCREC